MLHSITKHKFGRLGAIALLLLVPMWLFHHFAHEHHEPGSDHVHLSSALDWFTKIDHHHEDHHPHPAEDHELVPIRLEKTKTCGFFVNGAVCSQTDLHLPSFESVQGPEPDPGPPESATSPSCRSRAPPFSFLV